MSTVFQGLQQEVGTVINQIGPVRVAAKYPAKQTANGKWMRNVQISDDSGKAKLTIWGESAYSPLIVDGGYATIRTPIKVGEYNGEKNFSCNDYATDAGAAPAGAPPAGAPQGAPPTQAPQPAPQAQAVSGRMDGHEMALTMAKFTDSYYQALIDRGIDKDLAGKWAAHAPQFGAQWFFGEKSVSFPAEDVTP